jgi:hypothetical protein
MWGTMNPNRWDAPGPPAIGRKIHMPLEPKMPSAVVPLTITAGVFALIYSLFGVLMCSIPNGDIRISGKDILGLAFMFLPLLSFPIFLLSLYSMKMCRNYYSAFFIVDFMVGLVIEGQFVAGGYKFDFVYFFSIPRIAVILAVLLLNVTYLLIKNAYRGKKEEIPGLLSIIRNYD